MHIYKYLPFASMTFLSFLDLYPKVAIPVLSGLVCLDGPNFIGKTTMTPLIKDNLSARGLRVLTIKQPMNTELVVKELTAIDSLIGKKKQSEIMSLKQEVFLKDRYEVERYLYAIYKDFDIILMDRGSMSTAVCQGKPYSFLNLQPEITFTLVMEDSSILVDRSKVRQNRGTLDPRGIELSYRNQQYKVYSDNLSEIFCEEARDMVPRQFFDTITVDRDFGNDLKTTVNTLSENIVSTCLLKGHLNG
jgi:thymidylate kinase